jgi:HPt (histidine-containing phosphotransfer) domain-containing protein
MDGNLKMQLEAHGIDVEGTIKRFSGNESLLIKFLKKFTDDTTFMQLEAAYIENDCEEIFKAVHTLKGIAGNLGMKKLFEICEKAMIQCRECDYSQMEEHYLNARAEYNQMKKFLKNTL